MTKPFYLIFAIALAAGVGMGIARISNIEKTKTGFRVTDNGEPPLGSYQEIALEEVTERSKIKSCTCPDMEKKEKTVERTWNIGAIDLLFYSDGSVRWKASEQSK